MYIIQLLQVFPGCRLYDALNARDIAAAGACLAPDVAYENLAIQDSLAGQNVRKLNFVK
jgi:ketosteroid isomerase-like protein